MSAPGGPTIEFEAILAAGFDHEERARWRLFRAFPHLLGASCVDDLTEEEVAWIEVQSAIDAGLRRCEPCDRYGYGSFCGHCGRALGSAPEAHCYECGEPCDTPYCTACGYEMGSSLIEAVKLGRVSWADLDERTQHAPGPKAIERLENMLGVDLGGGAADDEVDRG